MSKTKEFQLLKGYRLIIISLILHAGFYAFLAFFTAPFVPIDISDIDIIYQDKTLNKAPQTFVSKTEIPEKVKELKKKLKRLEKKARYLSKENQRVVNETVARYSGKTVNRRGNKPPNKFRKELRQKLRKELTKPLESNIALQAPPKVAIGAGSSVSQHIPFVKKGYFTALNTSQFTYYTFFQRLSEQVRGRWVSEVQNFTRTLSPAGGRRVARQNRITKIEIILNSKGLFEKAIIFERSGIKALDWAAIRAFKKAAPYINPPAGLLQEDGKIHLYYSFVVEGSPLYATKSQ